MKPIGNPKSSSSAFTIAHTHSAILLKQDPSDTRYWQVCRVGGCLQQLPHGIWRLYQKKINKYKRESWVILDVQFLLGEQELENNCCLIRFQPAGRMWKSHFRILELHLQLCVDAKSSMCDGNVLEHSQTFAITHTEETLDLCTNPKYSWTFQSRIITCYTHFAFFFFFNSFEVCWGVFF